MIINKTYKKRKKKFSKKSSSKEKKVRTLIPIVISLEPEEWRNLLSEFIENSEYKKVLEREVKRFYKLTEEARKNPLLIASQNPLQKVATRYRNSLIRKATISELIFKSFLEDNNVAYEFQKIILLESNSFYILDFYLPKYNVVVEIDGSQHYTEEGVSKDAARTEILQLMGINDVLRIKNKECKRDKLTEWFKTKEEELNKYTEI